MREGRGTNTSGLAPVLVLIAMDATRFLDPLLVQSFAMLLGEVAIALCPHAALFLVDASLLVLEP